MAAESSPLVFGEVLFDCFPDGSAVLGGAPFNVAWHLHGLGLAPLMITGVGDDEHGKLILNKMRQWGMNTSAMQINPKYPTGQVTVRFNNGEPSYTIEPDQAYDHVDLDAIKNNLVNTSHALLYHGTLVMRTPQAKNVISDLIRELRLPVFVDVNLRAPWWNEQEVKTAVANAKWVKLNEDELSVITASNISNELQLHDAAKRFYDDHDMELLIVTSGEKGALCISAEGLVTGHPVVVKQLVDTVGAGDSFSAMMIAGIIKQWPLQQSLDRALAFAAKVCQMRGATTMDRGLYEGID